MKQVTSAILFAFCLVATGAARASDSFANCRQCLVVVADSWSSQRGTMFAYERSERSDWRRHGSPIPVVLGESGLAWGRGIVDVGSLSGPKKKEGDERAPAGIFGLRSVFGYAPAQNLKMPYLALSEETVAVDDPHSRYYNRLVDKAKTKDPDWRSAEKMILADNRYKWGVFVEHNTPPKPGAGSCIFLHVWKDPATLTSGCTAMSENDLVNVIHWLDPERHPLLVQMPTAIYLELGPKWNLPGLPHGR